MSRLTSNQADRLSRESPEPAQDRRSAPASRVDAYDDSSPVPVANRIRVIVLLALALWAVIGGVAALLLA